MPEAPLPDELVEFLNEPHAAVIPSVEPIEIVPRQRSASVELAGLRRSKGWAREKNRRDGSFSVARLTRSGGGRKRRRGSPIR
jgi:hypothetical protein